MIPTRQYYFETSFTGYTDTQYFYLAERDTDFFKFAAKSRFLITKFAQISQIHNKFQGQPLGLSKLCRLRKDLQCEQECVV